MTAAGSEPGSEQMPETSAQPGAKTGRGRILTPRRALLGGIPVMMTLASKSALAGPACTISRVMSGNMSLANQIQPTESCAVSPGCWSSVSNWDAVRGLCTKSSDFGQIFGMYSGGKWSCKLYNGSNSTVTMLAALQGKCRLLYTPQNQPPITVTYGSGGYSFVAQCAAAFLNAAAFSPSGHYLINGVNRDVAWVLSQCSAIWATTPSPENEWGCNHTVSNLCNAFSSSIQGAECTSQL